MTFMDGWWYAWHALAVPSPSFVVGWATATGLIVVAARTLLELARWGMAAIVDFWTQGGRDPW